MVTFTEDGAWCWFQDPRATRYVGQHDRTYAGWVSRDGDIELGAYDHDAAETTVTTLHAGFEPDDHDAPGVTFLPDGRVVALYSRHGGPDVRYRVTRDPEDVTTFGQERVLAPSTGHTYANPRWLDGDLHLFYRNAEGTLAYVISEDEAETWSDERELVTTDGRDWCVYFKIDRARDGSVDVGMTFAEGGTDNPHRHVHHARFDGSALTAADGSTLAGDEDLPVTFWNAPAVYDSDATDHDAWIWDCRAPDGAPALAYAELRSVDDHRYRVARWTNGEWVDEEVCAAGRYITAGNDERYYSAGITLDDADAGTCYVAVGDHEGSRIERRERGADGWAATALTDEDAQHVRPYVPWRRSDDLPVLWMEGSYTHYLGEDYDTALVGGGGE